MQKFYVYLTLKNSIYFTKTTRNMKKILVLGAGKSATTLISYLLEKAEQHNWHITVGDFNIDTAIQKIDVHERGTAIFFDVKNTPFLAIALANLVLLVIVLYL